MTLISNYTHEWTDCNEHDPEIILVELFAYIGDVLFDGKGKGSSLLIA